MKYTYIPRGICPTKIMIEIEDDILKNIYFKGGCHGNLQAISTLVRGMPVSEVKKKLAGITCGDKFTSCADQLARGIDEALAMAEDENYEEREDEDGFTLVQNRLTRRDLRDFFR